MYLPDVRTGGGPQLNKLEQVYSLGHQMSVLLRVLCLQEARVRRAHYSEVPCLGWRSLYGEVQCIMGNGHMGLLVNRQADTTENITFPKLSCRVGNNVYYIYDHFVQY